MYLLHLLDGTAAVWMKSSVFIHLTQLPSNPILFGFGWLALRCDFSKTKIQPLTIGHTPFQNGEAFAAILSSITGYQHTPLHCRAYRCKPILPWCVKSSLCLHYIIFKKLILASFYCWNCHWHQMTFSCLNQPMLKRLDLSRISIKPGNPSELAFHSLITFAQCCPFLSNHHWWTYTWFVYCPTRSFPCSLSSQISGTLLQ